MSDIINFLAGIVRDSEEAKEELEREKDEIDKRELQDMQQVETEWGHSISEAISEIEEEVEAKNKALEQAVSDLQSIEDDVKRMEEDEEIPRDLERTIARNENAAENLEHIDAPTDEEKAQMYANYVDDLRNKLEEAVKSLEKVEQIEENIEGEIEQAEHSFRNLIQRIEEVHQAEDKAEDINADARAHLMQLKRKSDKLLKLKKSLNKAQANKPGLEE